MKASLIEKYDRSRYSLIKWITIGYAMWFGLYIFQHAIENNAAKAVIGLVGLIGWAIFVINLIKTLKLRKKIDVDEELKIALNDELITQHRYQSMAVGFWTALTLGAIMIGVTNFIEISAQWVAQIIVYAGVLSALIAFLIINRD